MKRAIYEAAGIQNWLKDGIACIVGIITWHASAHSVTCRGRAARAHECTNERVSRRWPPTHASSTPGAAPRTPGPRWALTLPGQCQTALSLLINTNYFLFTRLGLLGYYQENKETFFIIYLAKTTFTTNVISPGSIA